MLNKYCVQNDIEKVGYGHSPLTSSKCLPRCIYMLNMNIYHTYIPIKGLSYRVTNMLTDGWTDGRTDRRTLF
jgi:hypothetical protein